VWGGKRPCPTLTHLLACLLTQDPVSKTRQDVSTLQNIYDAEDLDFRLRSGSAAVDRGMVLPTVTDGFTGSAPDLGALEVGGEPPHYGPRG